MAHYRWVIRDADKERASELSEKFNIDPFIAFLLVSRGITDDLSVSSFLSDSFEVVSPFRFAEMEEAAFTVGDAVDNGERICIYGDYDCDGVTSTALLLSYLRKEGADVFYYIPSREHEGYGLNKDAIDSIHAQGAQLIITVDNGISAIEEAEYIYSLGMRLVVTDHHQLGSVLPRAEAVVNPHREDNELEFTDYCGVGVAFKLICAMHQGDPDELIDDYIDLVAIGTIADVVPLIAENRAFVRAGLSRINRSPRISMEAFRSSGKGKTFSANDIAFQLCPRLNATGRMGDASRAVEFLISEDKSEAYQLLEQLNEDNQLRQFTEKEILADVTDKIAADPKLVAGRVIVIAGRGYHSGVIGIVASHISQRYAKPAFIIGIDPQGTAVGSARSIEGFNIYDAIAACEDDLIRFGGHPLAAGVTLEEKNIDLFRRHINEYALSAYETMPPATLTLDCKISPNYLNLDLVNNLELLEPYGHMNPQAVFGVYNMKLLSVSPLSEGKHIRLELERKGRVIRVVQFSSPFDEFPYKEGDILNLAVKVSKSLYHEKYYLSVQAVDIRLASTDDEKYFKEKNDYELYQLTKKPHGALYPSRDTCAAVYRFLKANGGWAYSLDDLYFRLQSGVTYGELMHAIKAFRQAGLITCGKTITLNTPDGKVNLENTKILTTLRERMHLG